MFVISLACRQTRSPLNAAKLPQQLRNGLRPEAFLHSILLENVIVHANKTVSACTLFCGEDCKGLDHLCVFGEIAVMKGYQNIQSKLKNKGLPPMCCGTARDHAADCFTFSNAKTKNFLETKNVNL